MVQGAGAAILGRPLFAPSMALTLGVFGRGGALRAPQVAASRVATGITQTPRLTPTKTPSQ